MTRESREKKNNVETRIETYKIRPYSEILPSHAGDVYGTTPPAQQTALLRGPDYQRIFKVLGHDRSYGK